jgi:RNA polymerase sigma-70 factor (ECF subfamily)
MRRRCSPRRSGRCARAQFEREALQHLDALYSFALKLARARDDAEDLVSDTLLRAFERWEQYRLGTNIRAWLFTILYHVFVSRKRRIDAREMQPHEDADGWSAHEAVGRGRPGGALLRLLPRRGDHARHRRAARRVPLGRGAERRAGAALRRDRRGAARARGTVKSRLFRGRRILQKKLAGYAVEMGYLKLAPSAA